MVDTLQTDVGGDGFVSPGDTVRYTITISNNGGQPLTNVLASITPDANSGLVIGSVAAPGGTVASGNGAGDADVEVTYASIPGGSTVTFTFDVTIDTPFPAGASRLEIAGLVSADGFDRCLNRRPRRARPRQPDADDGHRPRRQPRRIAGRTAAARS